MTLANVDWLSISITLLLILFVVTALLMSLLILMQRPKQEGLGAAFGSGMTDQIFGARTTNVLQKGTVYLATLFFVLTLTLAILYARQNENRASMVKDPAEEVGEEAVESEEVGESSGGNSLEEQLDEPTGSVEDPTEEDAPSTGSGAAVELPPANAEESPGVTEPESVVEEPDSGGGVEGSGDGDK